MADLLRFDSSHESRIEIIPANTNQGTMTAEEEAEYREFVEAVDVPIASYSGRIFRMSTVIEQVEAFRQYVLEQSQMNASEASLEELFQRWFASRLSETELEQSLQSLNRGLADADTGWLVDANIAIQESRARILRNS